MLCHGLAQRFQEAFEQLEGFGLVFVQGVALGIAPEVHDRAEVIQPLQMFAPFAVDGLDQDLLFDVRHGRRAEGRGLFGHHLVRSLDDPLFQDLLVDAFLGCPGSDRQVDVQHVAASGGKPIVIPLIRIAFRRQVQVNQIFDHLVAHVGGDFADAVGFKNLHALTKDGLALVVHHVVELQQLLANVEVAAFDLGLRLFQAFVDPGVNDGFTFLHPQLGQDAVQPFRSEDAHQVIFQRQEEG